MSDAAARSRTYEEIANLYDRQGQGKQRDIFLVLAADLAFEAQAGAEAERLRQRLMALNPYNLFRPYSSFAEAIQSPDIQLYIEDLRRQFPPSQAEALLRALRKRVSAGTMEKSPFLAMSQAQQSAPSSTQAKERASTPPLTTPPPQSTPPVRTASPAASPTPSKPAVTGLPANAGRPAYSAPLPATRTESPRRRPAQHDPEDEAPAHGWVSVVLALLALALGVVWLCYTFIEPFLVNG